MFRPLLSNKLFVWTLLRLPERPNSKMIHLGYFPGFFSHQLLISNLLCYSVYFNEKYSIWISFEFSNKNTLTWPVKCEKTTRHHAHLSLCAKSRKTNAKSRKWPKTSIWAIFWRFRGQISPNCKFFWKISFIQIEGHI